MRPIGLEGCRGCTVASPDEQSVVRNQILTFPPGHLGRSNIAMVCFGHGNATLRQGYAKGGIAGIMRTQHPRLRQGWGEELPLMYIILRKDKVVLWYLVYLKMLRRNSSTRPLLKNHLVEGCPYLLVLLLRLRDFSRETVWVHEFYRQILTR